MPKICNPLSPPLPPRKLSGLIQKLPLVILWVFMCYHGGGQIQLPCKFVHRVDKITETPCSVTQWPHRLRPPGLCWVASTPLWNSHGKNWAASLTALEAISRGVATPVDVTAVSKCATRHTCGVACKRIFHVTRGMFSVLQRFVFFCISYEFTRIEMPGGKIPRNPILS